MSSCLPQTATPESSVNKTYARRRRPQAQPLARLGCHMTIPVRYVPKYHVMRSKVTWAYAAHPVRPETISCCCLLSGNCPILRASRSTDWQRRRASVLDANLPAFSAHSWSTLLRSGAAFLLPVSVTSRRTLTALVRPGAWDISLSLYHLLVGSGVTFAFFYISLVGLLCCIGRVPCWE